MNSIMIFQFNLIYVAFLNNLWSTLVYTENIFS